MARTILEIVKTGSFVRAAANLNLTQTAVSARIRVLEDQLDRKVFVRNKAGARLTPAGDQFLRFATSLVQVWDRARRSVALAPGQETVVTIGAELSQWNPLLCNWLLWMRRECPEIAISAHIDTAERLMEEVQEGTLDIAILYAAPARLGVIAELLFEEKLVLVRTPPLDQPLAPDDHVHVDWGEDFAASYHAAFPDAGNAVVSIEDEGPGVPADFRDRIFERFAQAGDGAAMSGGTGLGLAISREIVLAHQGRIWFGEARGGGACFSFSLPLPSPDPRTESGVRPRILVCEAQAEAAETVRGILEGDGCLVDCVATGREARQAARTGRYDGLILDVALPDENGLEVVRALRRRADTRLLPIIIVSGIVDPETAGAAALEVIDWIDKPVDQERLVLAVRRAVEHSATTRPTLLHIDDDLDMLEVTATALAEQGRMLRATTVASARELLGQQTPDIVILDVALPDGSGLDLLPDLLLADGTAIPTIIYSARDVLPEVRGQVDAVLIKSRRSLPNLAQAIRRLLAGISTTDVS